jgi:hypothetical protein
MLGKRIFFVVTLACIGSGFAGCAGRESRNTTPANEAEHPSDNVLVPEPAATDDSHSGREFAPPPEEPQVDLSTLPPGPVSCSDCGPAPGYPSWGCKDGVHQGGRGDCVQLSDGRCGWINLVCPASGSNSCSASDCGASPVPVQWRCPDEQSSGRYECVRSEEGPCGWTLRRCPPGRRQPPPPPPAAVAPPRGEPCDPLPSIRVLRSWEIQSICHPGGGPVQPERRVVLSLGDGTHIIEERRGCFRARYRQCFSK